MFMVIFNLADKAITMPIKAIQYKGVPGSIAEVVQATHTLHIIHTLTIACTKLS